MNSTSVGKWGESFMFLSLKKRVQSVLKVAVEDVDARAQGGSNTISTKQMLQLFYC